MKINLSCEEIIELYSNMVYRIAISQVGNKNAADDIFQDVFLQLIKHLDSIESEEHLKHWLIRTTINRCKNYFTSFWNKHIVEISNDIYLTEDILPPDIYFLVLSLPQKLKSVVYLYYYEKYDVNEIATILKTKPGTVKSRLHKARNVLKEQITKE